MNSTQQNIAITEEYAHGDPDAGAQGLQKNMQISETVF